MKRPFVSILVLLVVALLVSGAAAFYVWMMGDDLTLER